MLVSCLLPTFNRFPHLPYLLGEAVESFLRQDYPHAELLICNDTPHQVLALPPHLRTDERIRLYNLPNRFPTLGAKLHWMLQMSQGEYICRWDDDDISLPWRLSYSVEQLRFPTVRTERQEWRPEQHWLWQGNSQLRGRITQRSDNPGNTHIMSIWHRDILQGATYPGTPCPSGLEDQTFNSVIRKLGYPHLGSTIPDDKIFYLYRWGVSSNHLSGLGGGERMNRTYREIGEAQIFTGSYVIEPQWHHDYTAMAAQACKTFAPKSLVAAP
jgi:glycosyltransferase involved in cell wall biosynthesis